MTSPPVRPRDLIASLKGLWSLLTAEQRRGAFAILGLMLIGMALEILGIGLIIPALALMTHPDWIRNYPALRHIATSLGNPSQEQLVVAGMLVLVVVSIVKTLFLAFVAWRQAGFVFAFQAAISQRLFSSYLSQPYSFHLQRNSAQLIHNTISHAASVSGVIQQALIIGAEMLILVGASALLFVIEPLGAALVVGALTLAALGFSRLTKSHVLRWGNAYKYHESRRHQHVQQGLGAAKEVMLLGREREFISQYWVHTLGATQAIRRQNTTQGLPRLWLELLAVVGLAALVLTMIAQAKPLDAILPTLGVFAAAAFRVMPSITRVLGALHGMRFSLPVLENLCTEFRLLGPSRVDNTAKSLPFDTSLTLAAIGYQYTGSEAPVLQDVNLMIPRGTTVGIIGGSGAGKSTLVDIVLGLLTPTKGAVRIDGVDIQTNVRGWQNQIGYVPQSIFLTDDTLRRNVALGLPDDQIDNAAITRAIRAAQLENLVEELPGGLDTVVGERGVRLSGGQRQRIGIARALYHDPSVLVLDEATSALDANTEYQVMAAVNEMHGEKTILIVAHRISTIENCDMICRLEGGRVVALGDPESVLHDPARLYKDAN